MAEKLEEGQTKAAVYDEYSQANKKAKCNLKADKRKYTEILQKSRGTSLLCKLEVIYEKKTKKSCGI